MALLHRLFGIDLRALAVFRGALGAIVLFDLLTRLPWVAEFYTDAGIQPRAFVPFDPGSSPLSLHTIAGGLPFELVLFAAGLVGAVMLLAGWHTRIATAITYVHQTSLWWRNQTVLNAGDHVLILLLFWSLFVPLGARWSLDARRRGEAPAGAQVASVGSAGLLLQVAFFYFFSVFHKIAGAGWWEGTAVFYAISHETWARPLGVWLRQFTGLLKLLTWGTLLFEFLGPLLLFSPVAPVMVRGLAIAGFALLQLGFGLSMHLWLFPWIMTAALIPFVPTPIWDRLEDRLGSRSASPAGEAVITDATAVAGAPWRRRTATGLATLALVYVIGSNIERQIEWKPPPAVSRVGRWFALNQGWAMYATARPYNLDLVVVGLRPDGSAVSVDDPLSGQSWSELAPLRRFHRGRQYLERLAYFSQPSEQAGFGDWVCRRWNDAHPGAGRLERVELFSVRRSIELGGEPSETTPLRIWSQPCE